MPSSVSFSHAYTSQRPPENNSVPQTSMAVLEHNRAEQRPEGPASQIHSIMGQQQRARRAALITQAVRKAARSSKLSGVNTIQTDTHKRLSESDMMVFWNTDILSRSHKGLKKETRTAHTNTQTHATIEAVRMGNMLRWLPVWLLLASH